jgi:hypothetical protein
VHFSAALDRATLIALAAVISIGASASAAPKTGCSDGASDWQEWTVEAVGARIWPALLDPSPWVDQADFTESSVRPLDKNLDGNICFKIQWGTELNPNSHWYLVGIELLGSPTQQFLGRDNTANASND